MNIDFIKTKATGFSELFLLHYYFKSKIWELLLEVIFSQRNTEKSDSTVHDPGKRVASPPQN